MQRKIVITGGPGTGKSTVLNELIRLKYSCMPEISREITSKAKKNGTDQLFLKEPLLFSQLLLEGREEQFLMADNESSDIVFFDRGIPDVHGYLHYLGVKPTDYFMESSKKNRYSKVFIMPPWRDIYRTDEIRYENFEQAIAIYKHIKSTYQKLNYNLLEVPVDTVSNRVKFILNSISQ